MHRRRPVARRSAFDGRRSTRRPPRACVARGTGVPRPHRAVLRPRSRTPRVAPVVASVVARSRHVRRSESSSQRERNRRDYRDRTRPRAGKGHQSPAPCASAWGVPTPQRRSCLAHEDEEMNRKVAKYAMTSQESPSDGARAKLWRHPTTVLCDLCAFAVFLAEFNARRRHARI